MTRTKKLGSKEKKQRKELLENLIIDISKIG